MTSSPATCRRTTTSAMDGYAVRSTASSATAKRGLQVVGTAFAERLSGWSAGAGGAHHDRRCAASGGADTVVVQEVARVEDGAICVPAGQKLGQNTRRTGGDLARGAGP